MEMWWWFHLGEVFTRQGCGLVPPSCLSGLVRAGNVFPEGACSYGVRRDRHVNHAHLNEKDAVTFRRAQQAMRQPFPCVIQRVTEEPSPVRSFDRFTSPEIPAGVPVLVPVTEVVEIR